MGTSGIVEPMSEQALIESIYIELNMLAANNTEKTLLITPGNYGEHFVRENTNLNLSQQYQMQPIILDKPWTKQLNWDLNVFYASGISENSLSWQAEL